MLVLTRKKSEAIVIGEGEYAITITVIELRGDKVRIGIEASRETPIHRQEVYDAIARKNALDSKPPSDEAK